ncbi:hypothetical protein IZY60_00905 [Lutibacter sp. B2]|nr:hypothetical protein [Lutibacter sp. B2]
MKRYTKIIRLTGNYFTKELVKKKHYQNQLREISEDTVAKVFLEGDTEILVYFQETAREVLITPLSDQSDIKKYLGSKFI